MGRSEATGEGLEPVLNGRGFNYRLRFIRNTWGLLASDTVAILLAVLVGAELLYYLRDVPIGAERVLIVIPLWWMGALLTRIAPGWGLGPVEKLRRIELLLATLFGLLMVAQFITRFDVQPSRIAYLAAYGTAAVLIPLGRAAMRAHLRRRGAWGLPIVIYGNDTTADYAVRAMRDEPGLGYQPIGIFDDDRPPGSEIDGIPVLGSLSDTTTTAPVAVLAAPAMAAEQMSKLLDGPLSRYRRVILLPDLLEIPTLWVQPCDFLGVLGLEISRNLLNPAARFLKYSVERLLVILTLPAWGLLLFLVALLIRMEDGETPFFLQTRIGRNGKRFRCVKFRTMHPEAEAILRDRLSEDESLREEWEANCKLRNDPRVTRVGRVLRRTSMDEFPQLLNVLVGDMSLVGPRPLPPYHHERLPERTRMLREQVRPGLTGLWQVSGRSESGDEGIERWDSYYVRNWSVWLDVLILARTFVVVLSARGAY